MAAKRKPLTTLTLAELGVSTGEVGTAAARVEVVRVQRNPERAAGRVLVDDAGSAVDELVEFLTADN